MNQTILKDALRQLAESLPESSLELILLGGAAGMLQGWLPALRTTFDCDVIVILPETRCEEVLKIAERVAATQALPKNWLNTDAKRWIHQLPLGWRARCIELPSFQWPKLKVNTLGRLDYIASKCMGAANARPQDLEDLYALKPTREELDEIEAHVDRLVAEDLDCNDHADVYAVLRILKEAPWKL